MRGFDYLWKGPEQGLNYFGGSKKKFSAGDFAFSTLWSGLMGKAGSLVKVPVVSSGRNSYSATTKQIITNYGSGRIQNISFKTANKILVSMGVSALPEGATQISIATGERFTTYKYKTPLGEVSGKVRNKSDKTPRGCLNCK